MASTHSPLKAPVPRSWWRRRPKIGARASIALHVAVIVLCAIAIGADTAPTLVWILLGLNAIGAALVGLALWIGELLEGFGPFTEAAGLLDFLDERTPRARAVAWLRRRGLQLE